MLSLKLLTRFDFSLSNTLLETLDTINSVFREMNFFNRGQTLFIHCINMMSEYWLLSDINKDQTMHILCTLIEDYVRRQAFSKGLYIVHNHTGITRHIKNNIEKKHKR